MQESETNGTWAQYQMLVLRLLEQHEEKLEEMRKQFSSVEHNRISLSDSLLEMRKEISSIVVILKEGTTTKKSMISAVDQLQEEIKALKQQDELREEKRLKEVTTIRGYKWTAFLALMSFIATIIWELVKQFLLGGK